MSTALGAVSLSIAFCACVLAAGYVLIRAGSEPEAVHDVSLLRAATKQLLKQTPTVGAGSGPLSTLLATCRSIKHCQDWIDEGYRKYKSGAFRVRMMQKWVVVVSGSQMINELHRAPDTVLSGLEAGKETLQAEYTLPHWRDGYEISLALIKTKLTRSLAHLFPEAVEEMDAAFTEELTSKLNGNKWTSMNLSHTLPRIICRTSNRLFVGLPLCRDNDFIDLNISYAVAVILSARFLALFPAFLRPFASRFTPIKRNYARAERIMTGFLNERLHLHETREGNDIGKPDDYLEWLLDAGKPEELRPRQLVTNILRLNFAAIHTTTMTFRSALYQLAAHPELYQDPLRKEAHDALSAHGRTTAAIQSMHKLDSLFREVLRYYGNRAVAMNRKAMQDFTFSNGVTIKRGETVCVAARPTHFDEALYQNADVFDAFRFCSDAKGAGTPLVSTSTEFLSFGTGRHACPGRFWAANELKMLIAYMLVHYDMRMEKEGVVPAVNWLGGAIIPDGNARVLLRLREAPAY